MLWRRRNLIFYAPQAVKMKYSSNSLRPVHDTNKIKIKFTNVFQTFDKVGHESLIPKLRCYISKLLESYIIDQRVVIKERNFENCYVYFILRTCQCVDTFTLILLLMTLLSQAYIRAPLSSCQIEYSIVKNF